MKVLVTGATGALGPSVLDALKRSRHDIRVFTRHDAALAGVEIIRGDISDASAVARSVEGVDAIVHLAAVLHKDEPSQAIREAYARVNVGGTANVISAMRHHGVKRLIFASSIAVYGVRGGILDESSPLQPDTDYARSKVAAEEIVRPAGGTILRFGAVYGPHMKGNYVRLVRALERGRFVFIGAGHNRRSVIYDADAAAAVLAALETRGEGAAYNVVHRNTPSVAEIIGAICSALQRPAPRAHLPEVVARVGVAATELAARAFHLPPPVTRRALTKYLEDVRVSSARIERALGFVAEHDIGPGWADALRGMREFGRL